MTKYRAQILLEQKQHQVLVQVAQRENRSLSDLVREIVREWLDKNEDREIWEQRSSSLERLASLRKRIQEQHGIYTGGPHV